MRSLLLLTCLFPAAGLAQDWNGSRTPESKPYEGTGFF
jgi:hypothetical protein